MNTPVIEYQGEQFRLTRSFDDYDEYKEASASIHPEEIDRIEATILSVKIPREFRTKEEFVLAALKIKFPGFGFGALESPENIHSVTIEIPRRDAYRYITAVEKDRRWQIVDDFKGPVAYGGTTVEIENGQLIYKTYGGDEFRRRHFE